MKIIEFFKNFWIDFFAAYYKRLKKNAAYETPLRRTELKNINKKV